MTKPMGKTGHRSSRVVKGAAGASCGLVIASILAFLLAGSVAALIWQMLLLSHKFDRVADHCASQMDVWKMYPGYFKSPDEHEQIIRLRLSSINSTRTFPQLGCSFECKGATPAPGPAFAPASGNPAVLPKIPGGADLPNTQTENNPFMDLVYHSCCTSGSRYVTPTMGKNLLNIMREVVQDDTYKQYFLEENCQQDPGCKGCQCSQPEPNIYQAVVIKDRNADSVEDMFEIDLIKLPGSCKCLNY